MTKTNKDKISTAIILAGGKNSRFFPLNIDTHKGAFPICGKPIIMETIENLISAGVSSIFIIVSKKDFGGIGLSAEIKKYTLSVQVNLILQKEATGMGNALLLAKKFIKERRFIVCFPYTLEAGNILKKIYAKRITNSILTLAITKTPWLYGIVSIKKGRVIKIVEKPPRGSETSNLKIQGLYILSKKFLDVLSKTKKHDYSFEDALQKYVTIENVSYIRLKKSLLTLKYPWHLFDFLKFFLGKNNSYVGNNSIIENNVRIKNSSIGNNTRIRNGVRIINSIILDNCDIRSNIKNSITSSGVFIDENIKLINKKHNYVYSFVKGKKINTGLKEFNTIIGNKSIVGKNASIKSGALIGSKTEIANYTNIQKNIPHNWSNIKLIIFDLDDTIFDTTGQLDGSYKNLESIKIFLGMLKILKNLKRRGFILGLVSTGNKNIQRRKIEILKIESFFDDILFCENSYKKINLFKKIIKKYSIKNTKHVFVVGDRIDREIMFGNMLDCITIRILHGKWKYLKPKNRNQIPKFTIRSIGELNNFLK